MTKKHLLYYKNLNFSLFCDDEIITLMVKNITAATRNQQGIENGSRCYTEYENGIIFLFSFSDDEIINWNDLLFYHHFKLVLKARLLYQSITCKPSSDH